MDIFQLQFNPLAILSMISFVLNALLLVILYFKSTRTATHKWLMLFIINFAVWSLGEFLSRLSATPNGAIFWERFSALGWIFVAPVGIAFIIAYIRKEKWLTSISRMMVLFGPAFLFLFLTYSTNSVFDWRPENSNLLYFGWNQPAGTLFSYVIFPWICVLQFIGMTMLVKFYLKEKDPIIRKQAAVLIVALITIILLSGISNGILQITHSESFVRMGVFSSSLMAMFITFAVIKYRLLNINPSLMAGNILETMNETVIVINPSQKIEYVNPAVEKLLGYKKEDVIGKDFSFLFNSNPVDFKAAYNFFLKGGREVSDIEVDVLSITGERIPVSFSVSAYKDTEGRILNIIAVVTDLRKIQELLDVTTEKNKTNAVIQTISDGILALDTQGRVVLANQVIANLFNIDIKEILHQHFDSLVTLTDNDDIYNVIDILPKSDPQKGSAVAIKKQFKLSTKTGKVLYINLTSSAIERGREIGIGAIITIQDISKERELEEMKLDFVSMAAHELRTPLTSIKSYLSVFMAENMEKFNADQKMFVNRISIASQQLINLVENLLSVARIERGAFTIQPELINWVQMVKEVVNDFQIPAEEKNIKLEFVSPSRELPYVKVDKIRILEVLNNLISNAINYTNDGGSISVTLDTQDGNMITSVKDTGKGIPKQSQLHLFTKFYRVSSNLDSGSKGNGLGLYISKAIVELHHGRIWVNSELNKGSEFSFSLPTSPKPVVSYSTPHTTPLAT